MCLTPRFSVEHFTVNILSMKCDSGNENQNVNILSRTIEKAACMKANQVGLFDLIFVRSNIQFLF